MIQKQTVIVIVIKTNYFDITFPARKLILIYTV